MNALHSLAESTLTTIESAQRSLCQKADDHLPEKLALITKVCIQSLPTTIATIVAGQLYGRSMIVDLTIYSVATVHFLFLALTKKLDHPQTLNNYGIAALCLTPQLIPSSLAMAIHEPGLLMGALGLPIMAGACFWKSGLLSELCSSSAQR